MVFWGRIKLSNLRSLSDQFRRSHLQIPGPCLANYSTWHSGVRVRDKLYSAFAHKSHIGVAQHVRFFAAPVQAKPKQEEKDTSGPRLNDQITAEVVRLVTDEGHFVMSRYEALQRATILKLDLVEVQRNAKPPVCKLMDYHREKYKQQVKEKDRAKSKSEVTLRKGDCKEVRFSVKTEQKDLEMKANMVKRLMERGYRVKCMAVGTEEQDLGGILSRLSALIEDVSIVESGPRVEKKQAYIIVRHVKFGPPKKGGSSKKASRVVDASSSEIQNPTNSISSTLMDDDEIVDQSESEADDEFPSEEEVTPISLCLEVSDKTLDKNNEPGTENRYKRDQRNANVTDARERMKPFSRFPNQRPDFRLNASPSMREMKRVETDSSLFENSRFPANNSHKQERLQPRAANYGIFGAPKVSDSSERNGESAENRYKKGNNFDSTRHPRPRGDSPAPFSDGRRLSGVDNSRQG